MNGPDHYRAGEAYLDRVMHLAETDSPDIDTAPVLLAIAQAHFAAAQAAAVAAGVAYGTTAAETGVAYDWRQAISARTPMKEA